MKEYHKIYSVYKRNMKGNRKLIDGMFSLPEFEYLKNNIWRWDEKVDGTNIRIIWDRNNLIFKGRTDRSQIPVFLQTKLEEIFWNDKVMRVFSDMFQNTEVCLYGEGYGVKIQKGGGNYISDGVDFILFDVRIGNWWLKREDIEMIAKKLNIKVVSILGYGTLKEAVNLIKTIGVYSQLGKKDFKAEGLVLRPKIELKARNGQRIITKIKCKDF